MLEIKSVVGHAEPRCLGNAHRLGRVGAAPLEKSRPLDRHADVLRDARLQPAQQAFSRGNVTATYEASGNQKTGRRGSIPFCKGRRIAQCPPSVGSGASSKSMTS